MLRGRTFTDSGDDGAPVVAIVNTAFAARHLAGEDPLGKRIRVAHLLPGPETGWAAIVGVAPERGWAALVKARTTASTCPPRRPRTST